MKKLNFIRRAQILQSAALLLVIVMMLALVRLSAILPGLSEEQDQKKQETVEKNYEKEYIRGSILDRNGVAIASSSTLQGKRKYLDSFAFSNIVGYWSVIYGTSGVERTWNKELVHSASKEKNKKGADVTLTLDAKVQKEAYNAIKDFQGSMVVLNAKTGEIIALASSPSYDVSKIEDDWDKITKNDGAFLSNAYQNPVTPGSVFKLVTSKEILENHIDKEKVEDKGYLVVNGQKIRNYNGTAYGTLTFEKGFVKSSNVYFMDRALKLGPSSLEDTGKSFLLGEDVELDFTVLHSIYNMGDRSDNVVASTAFGQGETLVTPLQMAMITQSVANGGLMKKPYLMQSVVNGKGKVLEQGESTDAARTMKKKVADQIKEVMVEAAKSYGLEAEEDSYQIGAKTGTAQRGDGTNNAWFVSFAPADDPQYVIVANKLKTKDIGKVLAPSVSKLYDTLLKE